MKREVKIEFEEVRTFVATISIEGLGGYFSFEFDSPPSNKDVLQKFKDWIADIKKFDDALDFYAVSGPDRQHLQREFCIAITPELEELWNKDLPDKEKRVMIMDHILKDLKIKQRKELIDVEDVSWTAVIPKSGQVKIPAAILKDHQFVPGEYYPFELKPIGTKTFMRLILKCSSHRQLLIPKMIQRELAGQELRFKEFRVKIG